MKTQISLVTCPSDQSVRWALNGWLRTQAFFTRTAKNLIRLDWANAQDDLSLHLAHMQLCWFCHEVAHFLFKPLTYMDWLPPGTASYQQEKHHLSVSSQQPWLGDHLVTAHQPRLEEPLQEYNWKINSINKPKFSVPFLLSSQCQKESFFFPTADQKFPIRKSRKILNWKFSTNVNIFNHFCFCCKDKE